LFFCETVSQKNKGGPPSTSEQAGAPPPLPSSGAAGVNRSVTGRYYPPLICPRLEEKGRRPTGDKSAKATIAADGGEGAAYQEMVYWTTTAEEQERIQSRRQRGAGGSDSARGGGSEALSPRKYLTFEPETAGAYCADPRAGGTLAVGGRGVSAGF
jgi:hypothetical protein